MTQMESIASWQVTPRDWLTVWARDPRLLFLALVGAVAVFGVINQLAQGSDPTASVLTVLLVAVVAGLIILLRVRSARPSFGRRYSVRVAADALHSHVAALDTRIEWSAVTDVRVVPAGVRLGVRGVSRGLLVPRRAFASVAECQAFADAIDAAKSQAAAV